MLEQRSGNGSGRGFAGMDEGKQREIASKGGKAAHAKGTAHEFDSEEARVAGRKGGLSVSRNRAHMAEIGRHGGRVRGMRAKQARSAGSMGVGDSAGRSASTPPSPTMMN